MSQYQVTGDELKSMILTFENFGKSRDWMQQASQIRSKTTIILKQKYEESQNISIQYTYLPLVEEFIQEWGVDFVPSDIERNLEIARQFLVKSPPNPVIVHSLQKHLHDVITDELLIALYHENEEVHVAINRENGECINPECINGECNFIDTNLLSGNKDGECNADKLDQKNEQSKPLFSDDVPFEWPTQNDEPEPLFSDDEKITDDEPCIFIVLNRENKAN